MYENESLCESPKSMIVASLSERIVREKMKLEEHLTDLNRLEVLFKANPDLQEALGIMSKANIRF